MPATKRIYKVDSREVEEMLAMAKVTDDEEAVKSILFFCAAFSIPIDEASLKAKTAQYQVIAQAIKKASK